MVFNLLISQSPHPFHRDRTSSTLWRQKMSSLLLMIRGGSKKIPFNIEGLNEITGFGIENAIN